MCEEEYLEWDNQKKVEEHEKIFHIKDGVFLGTVWGAEDLEGINKNNIKVIINCTCSGKGQEDQGGRKESIVAVKNHFEAPEYQLEYINYILRDHVGEKIEGAIEDSFKKINQRREEGKNILVHCSGGLSRSVTIIVAWLMKTYQLSLNEAVKLTRRGRERQLQINSSFWSSLFRVEKELRRNKEIEVGDGDAESKPSFDYTKWVVDDFRKMGFDAKKIEIELTRCGFDADECLERLLSSFDDGDNDIDVNEERIMV